MRADRVVCIPVTDDDRLVGVVSRRDLLLFARPDAEIRADVGAAVAAALPDEDRRSTVSDGVVELAGAGHGSHAEVARRATQSVPGVVRVLLRNDAARP